MDWQETNNTANVGERSLWSKNTRDQRRVCECGIAQLKGNRRRWKIPWRRFPRKGTRTRKTKAIPKASERRTRHRLRWSGRPDALTHTYAHRRTIDEQLARVATRKRQADDIGNRSRSWARFPLVVLAFPSVIGASRWRKRIKSTRSHAVNEAASVGSRITSGRDLVVLVAEINWRKLGDPRNSWARPGLLLHAITDSLDLSPSF